MYTEAQVFSRRYGYAGTLDAIADLEGVPTLLDFKTSFYKVRQASGGIRNIATFATRSGRQAQAAGQPEILAVLAGG